MKDHAAPGQTAPMNPSLDAFAARFAQLAAADPQFRATLPDPAINATKVEPGLGLAQVVALCMEGYADRPALAQRATQRATDPKSGRTTRALLGRFETITYRELWTRARSLASVWQHDEKRRLAADDRICLLGFAGIDFATVDLAAIHNGAVVVPMPANAPLPQLRGIFNEVEPIWLATSLECLDTTIELVVNGHRPAGLLLFDYDPEVDDERETFEAAQARLVSAGLPDLLTTLQATCARGGGMPPAALYAQADTEGKLCTLYYTSGSTGAPKGAMWPERMLKTMWSVVAPIPFIYVSYMPLNHTFGRSGLFATLGCGGLCYFTAKSDLSELFEDIRLARPTNMGIVPRVCEMVFQHYQSEFERRTSGADDLDALEQALIHEIRNAVLGGRLLTCSFASAPLAPELRKFMETCLGFPMDDNYGTTEISGVVRNRRVLRPPVIDYKLDDVPELGYFRTDKPYPRGELRIKTQCVMLGYFKRPELTTQMFDEDGYYKTGDIMAEVGPDMLVYVDRRNNVLKLAQGEFVAISRLEGIFTNGHPAIRQAYLYGTGERAFLLGVIVPNEDVLAQTGIAGDAKAVKAALRKAIREVARTAQLNAYEVPRDFIVEHEPFSTGNGLLAGIGKYQRPKFKERYAEQLERIYDGIAAAQAAELQALRRDGRTAPALETVGRAVQATLGIEDLDLSTPCSFAELGGDSLSALSCSLLLEEIYEIEVPAAVVNHPAGSLQQLARFVEQARDGGRPRAGFASVHGHGAVDLHARDLALDRFIDARTLEDAHGAAAPATSDFRTVLVTGANGYLGRFLCLEWLERMHASGGRVICIARGRDATAARRRIAEVFDSGDAALKSRFEELADKHLEVLAGDLGEPDLGLGRADFERLAHSVDLIVHPAAFVNHVLPYAQLFGPNVAGTAEVIRLAITRRLKPIHHISTIGVALCADGSVIDEDADVRTAMPSRRLDSGRYADGYTHSKWAAEVLLREAHDRFGLPISVFRCDMILAHGRYRGQINVPDMFTRWLFSVAVTGLAPRSFYSGDVRSAHYDGLPADFAAAAIAAIGTDANDGYHTYHVSNPHDDGISMDRFVEWANEAGYPIQYIEDYAQWHRRFEIALRALPDGLREHSFLPLLSHFDRPLPAELGTAVPATRFADAVRTRGIGTEQEIPHLSAGFIRKCLDDLRHLELL